VAQDVIVMGDDCGSTGGVPVEPDPDGVLSSVGTRCFGRFPAEPIVNPDTGEIVVPVGTLIDHILVKQIDKGGVLSALVRSPMTCANARGVCQMCYGMDLARHELIAEGAAVGIIAAQSMGEPATQLTMRTFHLGGIATVEGLDVVAGLPRVEELFEARVPKGVAVMSDIDGTIELVEEDDQVRVRVVASHVRDYEEHLGKGMIPIVEDGDSVASGATLALPREVAEELLARKAKSKSNTISKRALAKVSDGGIYAPADGVVEIKKSKIVLRSEVEDVSEYPMSSTAEILVQSGQLVRQGDQITDGALNPQDILRLRGRESLQKYIVREVQKTYGMVGVAVNDKHIEIIIRQMLRREVVDLAGDTDFLPGTLVDRSVFTERNDAVRDGGGTAASSHSVLLGVTKASLNNESFLAAASFQDTTRVLTEAVVEGKTDNLHGLKENVIIGKLIPAGSGWNRKKDLELAASSPEALLDTEAMDMSEGLPMDPLVESGNGSAEGEQGAVDSANTATEGHDDALLAGIANPSAVQEGDEYSGFLQASEESLDEESVGDSGSEDEGKVIDDETGR